MFLLHGYTQSSITWKPYIIDFEKEYSLEDRRNFESKRKFSEDVIGGKPSIYITERSKFLWVTENELALIIKAKADASELFTAQCENERDTLLNNL